MATDLGKVGIVTKGTWSSSATYEILDAVSYNGGLYIAKQAVPANTAPTNTTYWQEALKAPVSATTINLANVDAAISGSLYCRKQNDVVTLNLYDVKITENKTFSGVIPADYRPTSSAARPRGIAIKNNASGVSLFFVAENGDVSLLGADLNTYYYGTVTFIR